MAAAHSRGQGAELVLESICGFASSIDRKPCLRSALSPKSSICKLKGKVSSGTQGHALDSTCPSEWEPHRQLQTIAEPTIAPEFQSLEEL